MNNKIILISAKKNSNIIIENNNIENNNIENNNIEEIINTENNKNVPLIINKDTINNDVPKTVFIVPYRNREPHKILFEEAMKNNLRHLESYKIFYAHQQDKRPFNRGAMKNIGFLAIKNLYPNHYKDITFVFHDVDCWHRRPGAIDYMTVKGKVKHYYGFTYALGGMFAIKGEDFENIKGFPNFWGWGMEDNVIYERCIKNNLYIDRSQFYSIKDQNIARPYDGYKRTYNKRDVVVYKHEIPGDITHLYNCQWNIENEMINITNFLCETSLNETEFVEFDIREGGKLPVPQGYGRRSWKINTMMK
jgi:hypothetical protein